jgi:hypothetical protein
VHHLRNEGWHGVWVNSFGPRELRSEWFPHRLPRPSPRPAHRPGRSRPSTACMGAARCAGVWLPPQVTPPALATSVPCIRYSFASTAGWMAHGPPARSPTADIGTTGPGTDHGRETDHLRTPGRRAGQAICPYRVRLALPEPTGLRALEPGRHAPGPTAARRRSARRRPAWMLVPLSGSRQMAAQRGHLIAAGQVRS